MKYPITQGYIDIKTYYSPCLTTTLISDNSIFNATKSKAKYLSFQTIKRHLPTAISKGYMTTTCCHQNNRSKDIVLNGIFIGGQFYSNPLIIPYLHPPDLHENIRNYIQYYLLHDSDFAHLCNK